jgi:hypothetical protein
VTEPQQPQPQQPQQPTAPETQMAPQQPAQQPGQPGQPAYPAQPGYAAPQQPYPPQPGYAAPQQPYPPQQGNPGQPGAPAQPGYPPQFPGLPPGSAVPGPPAGSNFSSGKGKTIGLIVAGVVAVGALGGIGALVFGGGGDEEDKPSASSGQNSGILDPKPVGSASPAPTEPTVPAEPTEPAEPTPTPEPEPNPPTDPPAGNGDFVTLPGNGLQVYVPPGWSADDPGQFAVQLVDGDGAYAFVLSGSGDASLESGALINQNLDAMLPPSSYTYELSNPQPHNPSGSIVSVASVDYDGTYVDSQSSLPVTGRIFGAVRSDGTVLLVLVEHGSLDGYNASSGDYDALLNETFSAFGGS